LYISFKGIPNSILGTLSCITFRKREVGLLKRLLETGFSNKILSFQKMLQTVQSAVDEILKAFYDNGWLISVTDTENAKKVEALDE